jgi:hypothetical protein
MHGHSLPSRVLVLTVLVLALFPSILPVRASPDFILSSNIPLPVDTAHSAGTNITVTAAYGFTGTVVLTDAYSSGLSCDSITPDSIMGSGTAFLSCHSSAPGLYNVTVTGVSGSITHTTSYPVNVTAASNPKPATTLGLSPPLIYGVIGTAIALAAASAYFRLRRRRTVPKDSLT